MAKAAVVPKAPALLQLVPHTYLASNASARIVSAGVDPACGAHAAAKDPSGLAGRTQLASMKERAHDDQPLPALPGHMVCAWLLIGRGSWPSRTPCTCVPGHGGRAWPRQAPDRWCLCRTHTCYRGFRGCITAADSHWGRETPSPRQLSPGLSLGFEFLGSAVLGVLLSLILSQLVYSASCKRPHPVLVRSTDDLPFRMKQK